MRLRPGLFHRPRWGSLQRSPGPLAALREGRRRGRDAREGEDRIGKERWGRKGRGENGRGGREGIGGEE